MFNFITSSVLGAVFMKAVFKFIRRDVENKKIETPQNLVNNIFGFLLLSEGVLG